MRCGSEEAYSRQAARFRASRFIEGLLLVLTVARRKYHKLCEQFLRRKMVVFSDPRCLAPPREPISQSHFVVLAIPWSFVTFGNEYYVVIPNHHGADRETRPPR